MTKDDLLAILDKLADQPRPCFCQEHADMRTESMLFDLQKKYGTVAQVEAKLRRMD